jgi:hypothetical protein
MFFKKFGGTKTESNLKLNCIKFLCRGKNCIQWTMITFSRQKVSEAGGKQRDNEKPAG